MMHNVIVLIFLPKASLYHNIHLLSFKKRYIQPVEKTVHWTQYQLRVKEEIQSELIRGRRTPTLDFFLLEDIMTSISALPCNHLTPVYATKVTHPTEVNEYAFQVQRRTPLVSGAYRDPCSANENAQSELRPWHRPRVLYSYSIHLCSDITLVCASSTCVGASDPHTSHYLFSHSSSVPLKPAHSYLMAS